MTPSNVMMVPWHRREPTPGILGRGRSLRERGAYVVHQRGNSSRVDGPVALVGLKRLQRSGIIQRCGVILALQREQCQKVSRRTLPFWKHAEKSTALHVVHPNQDASNALRSTSRLWCSPSLPRYHRNVLPSLAISQCHSDAGKVNRGCKALPQRLEASDQKRR